MKSPKDLLDAAIAEKFVDVPREYRSDFMNGLGESYALTLEVIENAQNDAYCEGILDGKSMY